LKGAALASVLSLRMSAIEIAKNGMGTSNVVESNVPELRQEETKEVK